MRVLGYWIQQLVVSIIIVGTVLGVLQFSQSASQPAGPAAPGIMVETASSLG
ncbi:MAG: hypothetical protein SFZ03_00910 [Candidatus Melainabacteria bacterium]|nr:hypothetical protein [Candidatus Melainabacteria bacterium]